MKRTAYPSALRIHLAGNTLLSWHGASPKPCWRLSQSTTSTLSGKSLADQQTRRKWVWVFNFLWKTLCATSLLGNSFCGAVEEKWFSFWKVTWTCRPCVSISLVFQRCVSLDHWRPLKSKAFQRSLKPLPFPRKGGRGCGEAVGRCWSTTFKDKSHFAQKTFLQCLRNVSWACWG